MFIKKFVSFLLFSFVAADSSHASKRTLEQNHSASAKRRMIAAPIFYGGLERQGSLDEKVAADSDFKLPSVEDAKKIEQEIKSMDKVFGLAIASHDVLLHPHVHHYLYNFLHSLIRLACERAAIETVPLIMLHVEKKESNSNFENHNITCDLSMKNGYSRGQKRSAIVIGKGFVEDLISDLLTQEQKNQKIQSFVFFLKHSFKECKQPDPEIFALPGDDKLKAIQEELVNIKTQLKQLNPGSTSVRFNLTKAFSVAPNLYIFLHSIIKSLSEKIKMKMPNILIEISFGKGEPQAAAFIHENSVILSERFFEIVLLNNLVDKKIRFYGFIFVLAHELGHLNDIYLKIESYGYLPLKEATLMHSLGSICKIYSVYWIIGALIPFSPWWATLLATCGCVKGAKASRSREHETFADTKGVKICKQIFNDFNEENVGFVLMSVCINYPAAHEQGLKRLLESELAQQDSFGQNLSSLMDSHPSIKKRVTHAKKLLENKSVQSL